MDKKLTLKIKNWSEFQHYKDRNPIWIKLHRSLLNDFHWQQLPIASKALAPMLWLVASERENATIIDSVEAIAWRAGFTADQFVSALKPLIDNGFIIDASNTLADCYQHASPEKEKETETKTETKKEKRERKVGSRLPPDWVPSYSDIEFAEGLAVDWRREADKFRDYWNALSGAKAVKMDWSGTWRNWIRRASENKRPAAKANELLDWVRNLPEDGDTNVLQISSGSSDHNAISFQPDAYKR